LGKVLSSNLDDFGWACYSPLEVLPDARHLVLLQFNKLGV
jgi:hypothetical protein